MKICTECGERSVFGRGLCSRCYQRAWRNGVLATLPRVQTNQERAHGARMARLRQWKADGADPAALRLCKGCQKPFYPTKPQSIAQKYCNPACVSHYKWLDRRALLATLEAA